MVPDAYVTSLVMSRLEEPDVAMRGWILDGFPRTKEQLNALKSSGFVPNHSSNNLG